MVYVRGSCRARGTGILAIKDRGSRADGMRDNLGDGWLRGESKLLMSVWITGWVGVRFLKEVRNLCIEMRLDCRTVWDWDICAGILDELETVLGEGEFGFVAAGAVDGEGVLVAGVVIEVGGPAHCSDREVRGDEV